MSQDIRTINLFLASPGDLVEERQLARRVVDEINLAVGRQINWRVELFGWEDTTPGFFRPQSRINEDVDRCDLFVGMLWKRWGQPPGDNKFQSGFEEEFERAKGRRVHESRPEIWLFLKSIDREALQDPGEGLKRVLAFRSKLSVEKTLMFKEFSAPDDWERQFRIHLSQHLLSLWGTSASAEKVPTTTSIDRRMPQSDASPSNKAEKAAPDRHVRQIAESLKSVLSAIEQGALKFNVHNVDLSRRDLARLTLIATSLFSLRYSEEFLGVHEANLLYSVRTEISLSQQEWLLVVRSSMSSATDLMPSWYWIKPAVKYGRFIVARAIHESAPEVRAGAIRLIRELKISLSRGKSKELLQAAEKTNDERITKQAIRLLKERGTAKDQWFLNHIEEEEQRNTLKHAAAEATFAILAREQPLEAAKSPAKTIQQPRDVFL
jgi:Domain of unknown function (DUF4062)